MQQYIFLQDQAIDLYYQIKHFKNENKGDKSAQGTQLLECATW